MSNDKWNWEADLAAMKPEHQVEVRALAKIKVEERGWDERMALFFAFREIREALLRFGEVPMEKAAPHWGKQGLYASDDDLKNRG